MANVTTSDFIVIGAGIAGASAGYWLAPHAKMTLLEREPSLGGRAAHASGRAHQFSSEEARAAGKKRHQRADKPS